MNIAFIGLGNMGAPMARNLIKAGHTLQVFDLNKSVLAEFAGLGAQVSDSPRQAAEGSELVITMLPAAAHVRSVYLNDDGVLKGISPGVPAVDCSTIDPQTIRDIAAVAAQQGVVLGDAPVSGGTGGAQAGTLTFMVGGSAEHFAVLKPVLEQMGRNIVHCGEVGTGQIAKICNNMLLAISMIGVSESMALGNALGIDTHVLAGIINTSTGRCWSSEAYNPWPGIVETAPASRGYSGGFGAELMLKDLGLATEAARAAHQPVILGAVAQQLYQAMGLRGDGGKDFSAIIEGYRPKA
ncbi:3-hydroxyisobutyrate dehydrogenase [Pseudomonas amygdali pv. tabaci str. ATCC 11528]|uniref:3-hydroxyisobutyrate dehydrogenase n=3 Tax=Pseudomonas syringae group genomosp. 2 TaxID=251698 RepID=A0AAX1VR36_PSEAJ|nr:3-hydroxyisobutyrate dehydrogenase [Pseudomonas amygdali]KPX69476.1 3-hydroxyisobutyrate dehydrogenase [Pseudomonas amygdali pv. lachrymans]KEZ28941.1 3-hydroxyisobutyrate dehydrogenase [Pseudomonas amygdali pv. tabaci str. 6605]KEZ63221.1 3-hydroxyisobutyrate dehydrogenase [Pseudomonas amygdali pv. tabaci str. ATCC 11528]KKY50579.1 3-hydroxyisobutyrate dehydrogenase [Pseudomonas amygdali pv. tabaci str. ATCC 11528]KPY77762.1 3-hydroxyisobutyrate dehydrogenase [Pseudomonas amygdali pv. taba